MSNFSSESGHETNDRLLKVMSILYCQSIAADFRKPVEILYPNMAANYLSIIKHPMDLGTLLLECMKGTATIDSIRDGLKLVFMNSIRFNEGAPMMEAISRHLESFASGLFEEIMHVPFYEKNFTGENFYIELIRKRTLRLISVCRMPLRDTEVRAVATCVLSVMKNVPQELTPAIEKMMKVLERYFLQWGSKPSDQAEAPILTMESIFINLMVSSKEYPNRLLIDGENLDDRNNILPALAGLLNIPKGSFSSPSSSLFSSSSTVRNHEMNTMGININVESSPTVLSQNPILAADSTSTSTSMPFYGMTDTQGNLADVPYSKINEEYTQEVASNSVGENISKESSTEYTKKDSSVCVRSETTSSSFHNEVSNPENVLQVCTLPYLHTLDRSIGELLVTLQERLMRGTSRSSVWQRPYGLVWAQPAKSPWWPAMVLATAECPLFPALSSEISSVNVSRIPTSICKQLQKLKAKFQFTDTKLTSTSTPSSTSMNLTVPEGYYLVEFFGTHDFGWLKQDATLPMTSDGSLSEFGGKLGCSAVGVTQAVATERWLENDRTKYMSPLYRQQYFKKKKNLEKIKKNNLKQNENRNNFLNSNNPEEHSLGEYACSKDDKDPLAHTNDWESANENENENENENDDEEHSELTHVPTLKELSAEVAVLSNPYKGRERFSFAPSSSSSFSSSSSSIPRDAGGKLNQNQSLLLTNIQDDNNNSNSNYDIHDDNNIDENDENNIDNFNNYINNDNSNNNDNDQFTSILQGKIKSKRKGKVPVSITNNTENKLDKKTDQKNKDKNKSKDKDSTNSVDLNSEDQNELNNNFMNDINYDNNIKNNITNITKKKSPGTKAKNIPQNMFPNTDTSIGLRAKSGDYHGLLANGLFLSSVLSTDSYMESKDRAIIKAHYFTKWTELVSPVPGGPTFPEQKKRGHKKLIGVGGNGGGGGGNEKENENGNGNSHGKDGVAKNGMKKNSSGNGAVHGGVGGNIINDSINNHKNNQNNNINNGDMKNIFIMQRDDNGDTTEQKNTNAINKNPNTIIDTDKIIIQQPVARVIKRRRRRSTQDPSTQIPKSGSRSGPGKKSYRPLASINAFNVRRDGTKGRLLDINSDAHQTVHATPSTVCTYPGTVQSVSTGASTVHGSFCILTGGCTLHTAGEGAIHTRTVDMKSNIFYKESKYREERKNVLRAELLKLKEGLLAFEVGVGERAQGTLVIPQGFSGVKKRNRNIKAPPSFVEKRGLISEIIGKQIQRKSQIDKNQNEEQQNLKINPLKSSNNTEVSNTETEGSSFYPVKCLMSAALNPHIRKNDGRNEETRNETDEKGEGDEETNMDIETSSEISDVPGDDEEEEEEEGEEGEGELNNRREKSKWNENNETKKGYKKEDEENDTGIGSQETDDEDINENENEPENENEFSRENQPIHKFRQRNNYDLKMNFDDEDDVVIGENRDKDRGGDVNNLSSNDLETEDEQDSVGNDDEEEGEGDDEDDRDVDQREEDELEYEFKYRSQNSLDNENENGDGNNGDNETEDEEEENDDDDDEDDLEDEVEVEVEGEILEEMHEREDGDDEENQHGVGMFSMEDEQEEDSDSHYSD